MPTGNLPPPAYDADSNEPGFGGYRATRYDYRAMISSGLIRESGGLTLPPAEVTTARVSRRDASRSCFGLRLRGGFFAGQEKRSNRWRNPISTEPRINDRIRVPEVRLVGPDGEQVGIVRVEDALRLALENDLDLVEVAPQARPPVCKLMDYGKFKYEAAQKARDARRNQSHTITKEMKLRLKIEDHDYETKKGHVVRFLKAGDKVKITIMFRGREQSRPELGADLLRRLAEDVAEFGFVESAPKQDGRNMLMVLGPNKRKH